MITREEYEALPDEEKRLVDLERKAAKSMERVQTEFYKKVGRINSLRFTTLVEKHCRDMMQLLYETKQRNNERYLKEGIDFDID